MAQNYPSKASGRSSHDSSSPQVIHFKSTGKSAHHFELAVNGSLVAAYRASSGTSGLNGLLASDSIFTNFHKGQVASTDELRSVFDMASDLQIKDTIVRQGVLHEVTSDKRSSAAAHKEEVLHFVRDNYANKHTKLPVDLAEISSLVESQKVHVGEGSVEKEAAAVAHALHTLTLRKANVQGELEIAASLAPVALGIVHKYAQVKHESQANFGDDIKYRLTIKPGDFEAFRSNLEKVTKGAYKFIPGQLEELSSEESDNSNSSVNNHHVHDKKSEAQAHAESVKADKKYSKEADLNRAKKSGANQEDS